MMPSQKKDYLEWQSEFENLPKIPPAKLWNGEQTPNQATDEQIISLKLINNGVLSSKEINIIVDCIKFYKDLNKSLRKFDYSVIQEETKLKEFIGYIGYAYNYTILISNTYTIPQTFRMVKNHGGSTKNNISEIRYPPIDVVKENDLYNRANSTKTTVFYSCDRINSCLLELKPNVGDILTLAKWVPKFESKIICYPIPASSTAQKVNPDAFASHQAFTNHKKNLPPLLANHLNGYFDLLNNEYSKEVNDPLEYVISAYFSEQILRNSEQNFDYGGIVYPSLGSNYYSTNLAMTPKTVDNHFKPIQIKEIEILQTHYERGFQNVDLEQVTVADFKVRKEADGVDEDGGILWK